MKRLGNGIGSVYKLSGKRSRPWVARKTVGWDEKGHPRYKYIGYYRTKEEAMRALLDYNKSPYSLNGERLIDIYDRFLPVYKEKRARRSVINFVSFWNHLTPLYEVKITDLSRRVLQEYFDRLEVSEITKMKIKGVLSRLFEHAVRYDIIPPERTSVLNYLELSSSVKVSSSPHTRITNEEIERLLQIDDDMAHFLLFLIYTGLRCGEYYALTDEDISDDMVLHIRNAKTEAGIREVPLSYKAQNLAPLPRFSSFSTMTYKYKTWRNKHGFDHKLHDTRHTCISLLTEAGVDERIIRAIVGHKGHGVTENVYTHISIEEKRAALNKI